MKLVALIFQACRSFVSETDGGDRKRCSGGSCQNLNLEPLEDQSRFGWKSAEDKRVLIMIQIVSYRCDEVSRSLGATFPEKGGQRWHATEPGLSLAHKLNVMGEKTCQTYNSNILKASPGISQSRVTCSHLKPQNNHMQTYFPLKSCQTAASLLFTSVRRCLYLCVLVGDLQQQRQVGVVEGVVQGQQGAVDAALTQVVGVLLQAKGLHPAHDALVGPDHHVCRGRGRGGVFSKQLAVL